MTNNGHKIDGMDMESGEATDKQAKVKLNGYEVPLHLPKLEDVGHPQVPETNQQYRMREINGKSDLEVLSFAINDPDFFALLEGEAGVGKNFSIDTICDAANWPRVRVNFSISSSYESLVGRYAPVDSTDMEQETFQRAEVVESVANRLSKTSSKVPDPQAVAESSIPDAATFQWVDGLLTKAVKNGWVFVADEINAADADALMPLNGLTEDRDSRYLTIEEKSEIVQPHERFRFVATRNPVEYAGTGDMNSALESRGYIIEYDYHEQKALKEIVTERTNVLQNESEVAVEELISLVDNIRKQEQEGTQFVTKISTRDIIKICRMTDIMPIRNAAKTVIGGIADPTDEKPLKEEIEAVNF